MGMRGGPGTPDPGQISWNYVSLMQVVMRAFDVKEFQISGPDWLSSENYDIVAKVPAGTTPLQFQAMLRNLLTERFRMKAHRESREIPIYDLVIAKGGPKLKESPPDTPPSAVPAVDPTNASGTMVLKTGSDGVPELPASMGGKGHLALRSFMGTMIRVRREGLEYLVERLTAETHRPVFDKTGLAGRYDYTLRFTPENMSTAARGRSGTAADGAPPTIGDTAVEAPPDVFSALQGQLGLKLEAKKGPADIVVISIEKTPIEN
jgi:uncharacterized protein (TIGR03435 family)